MIKHFDPIDILFILLISCYLIAFFSILFILWHRKYKINKVENVEYTSLQIPVVDKLETSSELKKNVEEYKKKETKKKITSISYATLVNKKDDNAVTTSKSKSKNNSSAKTSSKSKTKNSSSKSKTKINKTNNNTKNNSKKKINNSKRNNSVVSSTKKKKTTNRKKNKKSSKKK